MKLKKIRALTTLLILPLWMGLSTVFVGAVMLLVLMSSQLALPEITDSSESAQPRYNLFAALPKKGEVLGQRAEFGDIRALKLRDFLQFYHSPMVGSEMTFLQVADEYDIPWTLLPAIACKESGCGRVIPIDSYNAFGWAVYTGQNSGANFADWNHSIQVVGKGLRNDYFNNGLDTVAEIETRYTPPSANSHHNWLSGVEYFMDELENWQVGTR